MQIEPDKVQNILVLRFSSMGDLILISPLFEHLTQFFPNAKITLATRADMSPIFKYHPNVHHIEMVDRKEGLAGLWRLYKKLNKTNWTIIYDAHGSIRSVFLRTLLLAPFKLVVNKRTIQRLALIILKLNALPFRFFKEQVCLPLKKIIGKAPPSIPTKIYLSSDEEKTIDLHWNFDPNIKVIGLVPSANWPGKRWPLEYFKELAQKLYAKGYGIVVFGGPSDTFCEDIIENIPNNRLNLSGKLSLLESFEGLRRCNLVIANDTGLMHAAEAVGTDVIALLGPTGEQFGWIPHHPQSDFLVVDKMWCRPCSKTGQGFCIRFGQRPCLNKLQVEEVFETAQEYFLQKGAHGKVIPLREASLTPP